MFFAEKEKIVCVRAVINEQCLFWLIWVELSSGQDFGVQGFMSLCLCYK